MKTKNINELFNQRFRLIILIFALLFCLPVGFQVNSIAQSPPTTTGQKPNQNPNQNSNRNPQQVKPSPSKSVDQNQQLLKDLENFDPIGWIWKQLWANTWLLIAVIFVLIFFAYIFWRIMFKEKVASDKVVTGRTADNTEIKDWQFKPASGMFYLGENYPIEKYTTKKIDVGIPLAYRSQHIYIEAPTGSKKTTTFLVPQLIDDAESKIVNTITIDRKGRDQFDATAKIWKDLGHNVYYLNPWDLARTMGFEPLYGATQVELRALVEGHIIISPDPRDTTSHYRVLEQQVLEAVFKSLQLVGVCHGPNGSPYCRYKTHDEFLREEKELEFGYRCRCRRHLCTLPAATDIISRGYYVIKALIQSFPAIYQYATIVHESKPSMQVVGMLNGLAGKMKYYLDPGPRETFSRGDFNLDMITRPVPLKEPKSAILYIDSPAEQGRAASVLASVMAQLIYQKVNERREILKKENVSGDRAKHLSLRFDEIGTFTIPDINNMMATIRDTNTGCILLLQDKEQFNQFYQKGVGETIQSNSFARIYTGKIEQKRAEIISKSIGNKIVSEKSFSYGFEGMFVPSDFERKQSKKQAEVPILSPDKVEVMCSDEMEKNETARREKRKPNLDGLSIIVSAMRPFVVKKFPYFRTPKHQKYIDLVNESKKWVQEYTKTTERQDAKHAERPRGFYSPLKHNQVKRLNPNPISWEVVSAVHEIIQQNLSENAEYMAITLKQSGQLKAKARDLGYVDEVEKNGFLDFKSDELFKKRFNGLTSADAEKLKTHLDEMLATKKSVAPKTVIDDNTASNNPQVDNLGNF